jgi:hypothetical protein
MWIRTLEKHPNQNSYIQFEKLVNLDTASAILIFSDGFKKWHVKVQYNGGSASIALFDTEQEAREAVSLLAEKLGAVWSITDL